MRNQYSALFLYPIFSQKAQPYELHPQSEAAAPLTTALSPQIQPLQEPSSF